MNKTFLEEMNKKLDNLVFDPYELDYIEIYNMVKDLCTKTILDMQDFDDEDVKDLFILIYKLIRLEDTIYDHSNIADVLEKNNIDTNKFMDYVSRYFGEEIKSFNINITDFSIYLNDAVSESIDSRMKRLSDSKKSIQKINSDIEFRNGMIDSYKEEISELGKQINKRKLHIAIKAVVSAVTLLVSWGVLKHLLSEDKYIVTEEKYSTISSDTTTTKYLKSTLKDIKDEPKTKVSIRKYDEDNGGNKRKYKEIDGIVDLGTPIEWYLSEEFPYAEEDIEEKTLDLDKGDEINTYDKAYSEVIRQTYEYVDTNNHFFLRIYTICVLLMVVLPIGYKIDEKFWPLWKLKNWYNEHQEGLEDNIGKLENDLRKFYNEIDNFESLQRLIKRLVEENHYLVDNPELLTEKVEKIANQNEVEKGKSYIKKHNKKRHI